MCRINYDDSKLNSLWNEYVDKRNMGLKKQANKMLNTLIEYVDDLKNEEREKFVYYLCDQKFEKEINLTFQQPLSLKVIFPVLFKSIENRQMHQLRWLYQLEIYDPKAIKIIEDKLGSDSKLAILQLANKIEPNDLQTVKLLLDYYLYFLWFGSHHLPEGILINKIEIEETKNEIEKLLSQYFHSGIIDDKFIKDYKYYIELYNDWFNFHEKKQEITFSEWCILNDKKYCWIEAYYYDK